MYVDLQNRYLLVADGLDHYILYKHGKYVSQLIPLLRTFVNISNNINIFVITLPGNLATKHIYLLNIYHRDQSSDLTLVYINNM